MIKIEYAERHDLELVLEMYLDGLEEMGEAMLKPNPEKCAAEVLLSWAGCPQILLVDEDGIFGFAGLKRIVPEYTNDNCINDYMFYIRPDKRSVKAAKMLSDAAQKVANDYKEPLYMSHFVGDKDFLTKCKFLERWGYECLSVQVRYKGV
jgi:hypothetical protein